jgi:glucoamylase
MLRLDLPEGSVVRYTRDDWKTQADVATSDTGLGLHIAELPTAGMAPGDKLVFTWRQKADEVWRGRDFEAHVVAP